MKYKRLTIACSAVLFAVILFLSACLIFTVRNVTVDYSCTTEKTKQEIVEAKKNLEAFLGKNIFSVNEEEVYASLSTNPYVKVLSVDVKVPARLTVSVEERVEYFCVQNGDDYYNLTKDCYVLCKNSKNSARLDGKPHVLIDGDTDAMQVNSELASNNQLFSVALKVLLSFEDVKNEVVSVTVDKYNEQSESTKNEWNRIIVKTKEGATFTVMQALEHSESKVALLKSVFGQLEYEQRTNGQVVIFTGEDNTVDWEISIN